MIKQAFNLSDTVIVQLGDVVGVLDSTRVRVHRVANDNSSTIENYVGFKARCVLQILEDGIDLIGLIVGHLEAMKMNATCVSEEAKIKIRIF